MCRIESSTDEKGVQMDALSFNKNMFNQNLSFKGFDKDFSIDKVEFGDVSDAIRKNEGYIENCEYVDVALSKKNEVCIKPKVPFSLTTGEVCEGENVFINGYTLNRIKTDGNGSLIVPVGVGERYNEVKQFLKLPFATEKAALNAERKLSNFSGGHYDRIIPRLAILMNISKYLENISTRELGKMAQSFRF